MKECNVVRNVCRKWYVLNDSRWEYLVRRYLIETPIIFPSKKYIKTVELYPEHNLNIKIKDIKHFKEIRLTYIHTLDLSATYITNIKAVGRCKFLHTLNLHNTYVKDIEEIGRASCRERVCQYV